MPGAAWTERQRSPPMHADGAQAVAACFERVLSRAPKVDRTPGGRGEACPAGLSPNRPARERAGPRPVGRVVPGAASAGGDVDGEPAERVADHRVADRAVVEPGEDAVGGVPATSRRPWRRGGRSPGGAQTMSAAVTVGVVPPPPWRIRPASARPSPVSSTNR